MRSTKVSLHDASVEEGLMAFSRASDVPFLIDSTDIPAQSAKITRDFNDRFTEVLGTFAHEHKISYTRWNEKAYLLWSQAETEEIVRRVRDGQGHGFEPTKVSIGALYSLFRKYLQEDPEAKKTLFKPFQITDLPLEMQKPVASVVLSFFMGQFPPGPERTWLDEESWQKARVIASVLRQGQQGSAYLGLQSVFETPEGTKTLETGLPASKGGYQQAPMAQDAPQNEAAPSDDGASLALLSSPLPLLDASSGAAMETPITLEVKRVRLRAALDSIEKQSGLRLSTQHAPALNALLLSSRAPQIPLFDLMNALSRLYGIAWKKAGAREWSADNSKRAGLGALALRVGTPGSYRFYDREAGAYEVARQNTQDIIDSLLESVDNDALLSKPGIAFSTLPPELRKAIREAVHFKASIGVAVRLGVVQGLINEGVPLQIDPRGRALRIGRHVDILFGRSIVTGLSDLDVERAQGDEEREQRAAQLQAQLQQQP